MKTGSLRRTREDRQADWHAMRQNRALRMSKELLIQFIGFESKPEVREYMFAVREASAESREFTITIAQEAFCGRRVSFQDGPDVCSLRLRRELAASKDLPRESCFHVTDAELEEYRSSHYARARSVFGRRRAGGSTKSIQSEKP